MKLIDTYVGYVVERNGQLYRFVNGHWSFWNESIDGRGDTWSAVVDEPTKCKLNRELQELTLALRKG